MHLSKPIGCTTPAVNPTVNYAWIIMRRQCRFMDWSKCTTLMGDVGSWGGTGRGLSGIWEMPVLSAQFCCEPKTALKIKVYVQKNKIKETITIYNHSHVNIDFYNYSRLLTL